ncbi:MAG TPA: GtrA family protein [Roseiarcus sp.]|jgi:putative flippase GtrA
MGPNLQRLVSFYLTGQFGKFLVAGGLAAVANFASRFAFERSFSFWAAVSLAYLVGFATAFALNRLFVFPASDKPLHREIGWFFLFNLLAFPVVVAAAFGLDALFELFAPRFYAQAAAHGVAIMLPVFVNFAAHKFITFAPSDAPPTVRPAEQLVK